MDSRTDDQFSNQASQTGNRTWQLQPHTLKIKVGGRRKVGLFPAETIEFASMGAIQQRHVLGPKLFTGITLWNLDDSTGRNSKKGRNLCQGGTESQQWDQNYDSAERYRELLGT